MTTPRKSFIDDLIVIAAAALTFARGVAAPLVSSWDDGRFLEEFAPVQSISWAHFVEIFSRDHFEAYHPLHLLAYWIDVPLFGPSGPAIHATNLVLWCGGLLLVRRVMLGLGLGRAAALLATLFYGLHPVQVEAVTWATGRKEIVALIFASTSILAHLKSRHATDRYAWSSRLAYLLAALAKTTVLPLPGLLFLIDVLLRDRPWKRALLWQLPALAAGLGLGGVVVVIWQDNTMIRVLPPGALVRIELVGSTLARHLAIAVAPLWNSPIYPVHRAADDFSVWDLVMLGVPFVLAFAWRRKPRALFALTAFLVLRLPVSNFIPMYFEVEDRYLSLPLLAVAYGLGALLTYEASKSEEPATPHRLTLVFASLVVAAFAFRTVTYQGAWRSDEALWLHATRTHPTAYYAWMKLAEVRRDAGDLDGALDAHLAGIDAHPTIRLGHASRLHVMALRDERDLDLSPSRALNYSARYLQNADDPQVLRELAGEMVSEGYRDAALLPLARALELSPLADEVLERAAVQRLTSDPWLARFYVSRMTRPPLEPRLAPLMGAPTVDENAPAEGVPPALAP